MVNTKEANRADARLHRLRHIVSSMAGRSLRSGLRAIRWGLAFAVAAHGVLAARIARAQLTPGDQMVLLNEHNALRSEVALGQLAGQPPAANMARLVWDDGIAQTAQAWRISATSPTTRTAETRERTSSSEVAR
jgi:hypothetical protein